MSLQKNSTMLPVSIIIRTLNEESNIQECIECCLQNNPDEIIVVDGGSKDNTLSIITNMQKEFSNIQLIQTQKGLENQRNKGIEAANTSNEYIAIVDADDRLEKNCIKSLLHDLSRDNAHAVQAKHEPYSIYSKQKISYWEEAMHINLQIIHEESKQDLNKNIMVGRPALYKKELLVKSILNAQNNFTSASEDSSLSYLLKQNNAIFTYGTGVTYRKHLIHYKELKKRWISYGIGDGKFIQKYPHRTKNILFHLMINYPIIRAIKSLKYSYGIHIPFFMLQGLFRMYGLTKQILKLQIDLFKFF